MQKISQYCPPHKTGGVKCIYSNIVINNLSASDVPGELAKTADVINAKNLSGGISLKDCNKTNHPKCHKQMKC